jgi:hypothetical protein
MVVRAALAMAGPPPVGTYVIIPIVGSPPPTTTPPPVTTPPPATTKPPTTTTTVHKYPERKQFHTNKGDDNYTKIAQQYGTGLTGRQLYDYQFLPQAGRSPEAIAKLRSYGPDRIYPTGTTAIPYPK